MKTCLAAYAKMPKFCAKMHLNLPFLKSEIHLYQKYGFYEIESYNNSPMDTSIYMKLDL